MSNTVHQCDHHCVLGNVFSKSYDESFIEEYKAKIHKEKPSGKVIIYLAKKIVTLNDMFPEATAIAIKGDLIYAVGDLAAIEKSLTLKQMDYDINSDYCNDYFYPGFIESHCHASLEAVYHHFVYVGAYERINSSGEILPALKTNSGVMEKLSNHIKDDQSILIAWGYDPSVLNAGECCITVNDLDKVSTEKAIVVVNMSGHVAYTNHKALELAGYTDSTDQVGVIKKGGYLTGELQELEAIKPLLTSFNLPQEKLEEGYRAFAKVAQKKGVTTISDLGLGLVPGAWKAMQSVTAESDYPVKVSNYVVSYLYEHIGGAEAYYKAKRSQNSKLTLSGVKLITDGSLQSYTAFMQWPYYYDKNDQGIANMTIEEGTVLLRDLVHHDIQAAIHTNGSAAIEGALDCIEHVLRFVPDRDPRFRLEHCQTVSAQQLQKMSKYKVLANFFINHIYFWGDFHKAHTLGPDRVKGMNPLGSAKKAGVTFALHSDSPVTAVDPLLMIQNAVERKSYSGEVLGENETISAREALLAVTKNAAYLLREENIKGTLEAGKQADITILKSDIEQVPSSDIANIEIIGTIVNGQLNQ